MRQIFLILLFPFLFVACASPSGGSPTIVPVTKTVPATLTVPVPAPTFYPSATPVMETRVVTPLPTIPTFTPTFDARTVVTVTPAPKAECPTEKLRFKANLSHMLSVDANPGKSQFDLITDVLNKNYRVSDVLMALRNQHFTTDYKDVTGDGSKEILFSDKYLYIFYCYHGSYYIDDNNFASWGYITLMDLNKNGLPEIISSNGPIGKDTGAINSIYEWNGSEFAGLLTVRDTEFSFYAWWEPPQQSEIKDTNQDGLQDLIFTGWLRKISSGDEHSGDGEQSNPLSRVQTVVYSWNGMSYTKASISLPAPQYRIQAIQDADREVLYGHFEEAMKFYHEVIFNEKLEWISGERFNYLVDVNFALDRSDDPDIYPTPVVDTTEYPRLAAYAYYRMMILQTHLGKIDAAQTQYTTLQEKFPKDSPGYPYVEMAKAFWDGYQSSQKIYNACAAAIAYADRQSKILMRLGLYYYGWQIRVYTPADICPFR